MRKVSVSFVLRALACALLAVPTAQAADSGELWEMTMQMSMPGMPAGAMQPRTQQVCTSKDMREAHGRKDCTVSDLKESASRVSYSFRCTGNPPTTGTAEFNFEQGRSRMKGAMRMTSGQGEMTMQMAGRNLAKACDPQRAKRTK